MVVTVWQRSASMGIVRDLELVMEGAVAAPKFRSEFRGKVNDKVLWAMVDLAELQDPDADIRPVIAAMLEYWARWVGTFDFDVGLRERVLFIAGKFADIDLPSLLGGLAIDNQPAAAAQKIVDLKKALNDEALAYEVEVIMPGIYAVHIKASGELYRVDCIFDFAAKCPDRRVPYVREQIMTLRAVPSH